MAAKLKELGWSVILRTGRQPARYSRSLADFEGRLKDAEVGLVFYAGHGIQKNGCYLVPSNAQIEIEEDSSRVLMPVTDGTRRSTIKHRDSTRDNPLPKRRLWLISTGHSKD